MLNQVGQAVFLAADMSATLAVGAAEGSWMEGAEGLGISARVVEGAPSAGITEASKMAGELMAGESVGMSEGVTAVGVEDEVPVEICQGRGCGLGSIECFAIKLAFIIEAWERAWKGSFLTFLPSGIVRTSSSNRLDTTSLDNLSLSVDSQAFLVL